ncbi:MAG: CPBP family intramembrane metalloprotease [Anaerolineales bacterium]|nr:CPBP family intramembrane metalloprotease [Anaerolineales bacterium]
MNHFATWIRRHQIIAFFAITFAITWGLGFSYVALYKGKFLLAPLAFIATCGPALAGIIISAICNTQSREGSKRTYWIAFLIAWVVSSLVCLAHNTIINHAPLTPIIVIFTIITVIPVAFVISMAYTRIPAVKNYMASLLRLRGVWGWALLALLWTPPLILISIFINDQRLGLLIAIHRLPATGLVLIGLVVVKFLYQLFFFNATGEEAGWRGFALPRLQARTSPLIACLVLNVFWPLWHFFLWMAEGKPVYSPEYWGQTYLTHLSATVVIGWFYNRSKGSILVAGIAHAAANTAFAFFTNLDWAIYNWTAAVAALVLIVLDRMWKKLPPDHPAVYQMPALDS